MSDSDLPLTESDRPDEASRERRSAGDVPTIAHGASSELTVSVPAITGYEVLRELGRGGMGVVYQARDTKLDRVVALKMVLAGKFASEEEITRFRIEGEAAARLDHPGIVPIYEIGDADGNHFFSMKFVQGESLSNRLEDFKEEPRRTVELMVKIARAIQHAHQRGVLHRDLKPANVLIDQSGNPYVTDFGLAKRMDGDSDLTRTGLVMGTPGFMAPEQAEGKADITTSADIFSLGAILFWMVTGQAPFAGENALQIAMRTIEGDTPSLRAIDPKANADLELICRKAMEKNPSQRYGSADAFADDLQAWLDGDVLSVRPPNVLKLTGIWIRKNMRPVAGATLSGVLCGLLVGMLVLVGPMRSLAGQEHQIQQLGGSAFTWVRHLDGLRSLSNVWSLTQFLIVPSVAICAVLNVLIVRPATRESNLVSAVTSGLVGTVLTFMTGVGLPMLQDSSIENATQDIHLLANAIWLDSDAERRLAQQALIQRYPGLEEMDAQRRGKLIESKILHDQTTGLIPGMWLAVLVSILFVGLPLTCTCVLSGMLWRRGVRDWRWFAYTWEQGAYCLVTLLIVSFWLRDVVPAWWIMLGSIAILMTCLYVAVRDAPFILRLFLMPVPFVCCAALVSDVEKMRNAPRECGKATTEQALRKQVRLCERLLDNDEISYVRYQTAAARLYLDDEELYREHCREQLAQFENAYTPGIASRLSKICMLRPDLHDKKVLPLLYSLSEFASSFESDEYARWFYATRALVEVRKQDYVSALEWNRKCRDGEVSNTKYGYRHAQSYAIDALAQLELGQIGEARESLRIGRKIVEVTREKAMEDGNDRAWVDWQIFFILEREAEGKLQGKSKV